MPSHTVDSVVRPAPRSSRLRLDLGVRQLLPEWRALFSKKHLKEDTLAGLTVACIAIPLSLAIALASGVAPEVGLVTAIVAGVVCALSGGTPLAVSGPAAAMAVLIATAVQQHGMGGLLVIGVIVGLMQLLTGVLGLGRLIRFVPGPVVAGFTAGIGAIILIGQLPRALGLAPPAQSHVVDVLTHLGQLFHQARPEAVAIVLTTLAIALGLPRVLPRLPAPLIAVIVPTVASLVLGLKVETIGELPRSLPLPRLPDLPAAGEALSLMGTALIVYALASLETLLSSGAVDKLSRGRRHEPDQELVGQGLGNVAVAFFGGIPVTGVIARSALNVQAGARTRRSAIIHSLTLLATVFMFAPAMSRIPIAALAGVLLSVALRMLHPRELVSLWKVSRVEAMLYLVTFVVIVLVDLIAGVQAGIVAALAVAAVRLGKMRAGLLRVDGPGPYRFVLSGPITFLSSAKLEGLRAQAGELEPSRGVLVDLSGVTVLDTSGAELLIGWVQSLRQQGARVAILGLRPELQGIIGYHEGWQALMPLLALTESDVAGILQGTCHLSSRERLVHGVERFRQERQHYQPLFDRLAGGQKPHALFITCADSRINPNLITSTQPGDLFIVRNVGNLVPPAGTPMAASVGSAIEYAVGVLGVTEVIVCGHSGCGAMRALLGLDDPQGMPGVQRWLEEARPLLEQVPPGSSPEEAARRNAILQLKNALSYPLLRRKVEAGEVQLHAWFYDLGRSELLEWNELAGEFLPLGTRLPPPVPPIPGRITEGRLPTVR